MNENPKPITEILATGLKQGGLEKAFNYPGFFSHELYSILGCDSIQLSEKHTYAEAFGSSIAGMRTAVMFKNVGLNVAADVFLHSMIAGVGAGLVLVIFDDIDVWGSQESQDSRHFLDFYGGLLLEPRDLSEAYTMSKSSFELSEQFNLPVMIRITNEHLRFKEESIETDSFISKNMPATHSNNSFIVHPYYWLEQHMSLKGKNSKLVTTPDFEVTNQNSKNDKLVIVFGASGSLLQLLPEGVNGKDVLRITKLPIHESEARIIKDKKYKRVYVLEYGQPYVGEKVRAITRIPVESITPFIEDNPKIFGVWERDSNLFEAISKLKTKRKTFVISDITRSTVEKHNVVDASLSYGSALSVGIGFAKAKPKHTSTICIVGDGSSVHEGLDTINYAYAHNIDLTLIIVDNGGLWCTGGQAVALGVGEYLQRNKIPHEHFNIDNDSSKSIEKLIEFSQDKIGFRLFLAKAEMGKYRGE